MARDQVDMTPIDSRDAFVLSLIDGKLSVSSIVDIAGMPRQEIDAIFERRPEGWRIIHDHTSSGP